MLADYERRNRLGVPLVHAVLSKLAGFRYDGSDGARRALVHTLPSWRSARANEVADPGAGSHRVAGPAARAAG